MLKLFVYLVDKEAKVVFQDLNSLIEALIKYRRAISQQQYQIIATSFQEILTLIEENKLELRASPKLVSDLRALFDSKELIEKKPKIVTKQLRSAKTNSKNENDGFVVVNKRWSLEPSKLTEHQREKMKTRRCDIPALYNDLSRSQDSASIQDWTPLKSKTVPEQSANDTSVVKMSTDAKDESVVNETNTESIKLETEPVDKEEDESMSATTKEKGKSPMPKRRMTRELIRIQSEAKTNDVPYGNVAEINRQTRSTKQKIVTEIPEKRKTRSESLKIDVKIEPKTDAKKKTTRASLGNSPASRQNVKNNKTIDSIDTETANGTISKRSRQTRQSPKATESNSNDQIAAPILVDSIETVESKDKKHQTTEKTLEEITESVPLITVETKKELMDIEGSTEIKSVESKLDSESQTEIDLVRVIVPESKIDNETIETIETIETTEMQCIDENIVEETTVTGATQTEEINEIIPPKTAIEKNEQSENLHDKSHMSTLIFNDADLTRTCLNDSSIVTSPKVDEHRNFEFLNDTLNISPITSNPNELPSNEEQTSKRQNEKPINRMEAMDQATPKQKPCNDDNKSKDAEDDGDKATEKEKEIKQGTNCENQCNIQKSSMLNSSSKDSSTCMNSNTKHLKSTSTSTTMQSSTPIQSHQSPVSSKYRPKLMGRGAQLLKMINKSPKVPGSPVPSSSDLLTLTAASPTINQLQTAPIYNNITTPEPQNEKHAQAEHDTKSEFLTFASVLPSPYESPGVSILKRKRKHDTDDSMGGFSPVLKRKRVSFNFPLSQTKEYIVDDDFTPFYMMPSNDSPRRDSFSNNTTSASQLKVQLKRNQARNDGAKTLSLSATKNKAAKSNGSTMATELST